MSYLIIIAFVVALFVPFIIHTSGLFKGEETRACIVFFVGVFASLAIAWAMLSGISLVFGSVSMCCCFSLASIEVPEPVPYCENCSSPTPKGGWFAMCDSEVTQVCEHCMLTTPSGRRKRKEVMEYHQRCHDLHAPPLPPVPAVERRLLP